MARLVAAASRSPLETSPNWVCFLNTNPARASYAQRLVVQIGFVSTIGAPRRYRGNWVRFTQLNTAEFKNKTNEPNPVLVGGQQHSSFSNRINDLPGLN
jgi:hypothetical protein